MTQNRQNTDTGGLPEASAHLAAAWRWVCDARKDAPAQADVWHLRHHWEDRQQSLLATLLAGEYRLSPMLIVGRADEQKAMWSAQDALVLKWVALQVAPQLPLHARCEHIKGHEGGPASVRKMSAALAQNGYRWVLRTDVKGYYANIDKAQLLNQVDRHVAHPVLRDLITQYVHYTVEDGGTFHTPEKGIGRSCPLSPLMGALYLQEMDEHFGQVMQTGRIYYARYMDDIVVLTHSRWQLRKHVRILNRLLTQKGLCQHPDKTFIGRTVKGFDWMGAWLEPQGVTDIAPGATANHREKVRRLYERAWRRREPKAVTQCRVSNYRWRWTIWTGSLIASNVLAAPAVVVVAPDNAPAVHRISSAASSGSTTLVYQPLTGNATCNGLALRYTVSNLSPSARLPDGRVGVPFNNGGSVQQIALDKYPYVAAAGGLSVTAAPNTVQGFKLASSSTVLDAIYLGSYFDFTGQSYVNRFDRGSDTGILIAPSAAIGDTATTGARCTGAGGNLPVSWSGTLPLDVYVSATVPAGTYQRPANFTGYVSLGGSGYGGSNNPTPSSVIIFSDPWPQSITILRASVSCTLTSDKTVVPLIPDAVSALTLSASCSRNAGTLGTGSLSAYISADTPNGGGSLQLPVSGSTGYIAGAWGSTAPACPPTGTSAVSWDGSLGPKVGSLSESTPTMNGTQVVTVKACNFGSTAPGTYSAQGVFSIVTQ
ncbi:reverse transcriptase domain-containing protein [Serratia marcescens]|uniref:reverse transcriptase domain-containing protein n=1 Tax=Serratia marcescens TaxID=615 RepID=UPI001CE463C9|nr:reverse transcriptase domain-containing protein [Serratia marcescens]